MTHSGLVRTLARALLLKEGHGKPESFASFMCLCRYFSEMSMEELLGVATQNGIAYLSCPEVGFSENTSTFAFNTKSH